jgi:hypothetical protein
VTTLPTEDSLSRTWLRRTIDNHHREQDRQKELEHERKLAEIRNAVPAQLQTPSRKRNRKSDEERDHDNAIRDIIRDLPELRGLDYCREVDGRTSIPKRWRDDGCQASSYAKAYRDKAWRKRIQDEKTRIASSNGL